MSIFSRIMNRTHLLYLGAIVCLLFASMSTNAQEIQPRDMERLQIMEDSMMITVDSMYTAFLPESHIGYSERFIRQLVKTLKTPNSYLYPFNKLKEKINIIYADDNAFRIFNWGIDFAEIFKRYYGAVQLPQENLKLYGLTDYTEKIGKGAEDSILTGGKWFGAIYYRIMAGEVEGKKIYTLFGLNEGNPLSNKKVLDPLTITDSAIVFGAPIFGYPSRNFPKQRVNRFVLEYKKDVHVGMNWDAERNVIVLDDLASQINDPNRRNTYVPTGQYNAFVWANEMWNYKMNIMPLTELKDGQAPKDEEAK